LYKKTKLNDYMQIFQRFLEGLRSDERKSAIAGTRLCLIYDQDFNYVEVGQKCATMNATAVDTI